MEQMVCLHVSWRRIGTYIIDEMDHDLMNGLAIEESMNFFSRHEGATNDGES